jgi:hypothetical protein
MSDVIEAIKDVLPGLVENALGEAMSKQTTPGVAAVCQIRAAEIVGMKELQERDHKILTGNGDPKTGLVTKFELAMDKLVTVEKNINSIKNAAWVFASAVLLFVLNTILDKVLTP